MSNTVEDFLCNGEVLSDDNIVIVCLQNKASSEQSYYNSYHQFVKTENYTYGVIYLYDLITQ